MTALRVHSSSQTTCGDQVWSTGAPTSSRLWMANRPQRVHVNVRGMLNGMQRQSASKPCGADGSYGSSAQLRCHSIASTPPTLSRTDCRTQARRPSSSESSDKSRRDHSPHGGELLDYNQTRTLMILSLLSPMYPTTGHGGLLDFAFSDPDPGGFSPEVTRLSSLLRIHASLIARWFPFPIRARRPIPGAMGKTAAPRGDPKH